MNIGCDFLLNKNLVSLGKFQELGRKAKVFSALKQNRQNNLGNWAGCLDTDTRQDDWGWYRMQSDSNVSKGNANQHGAMESRLAVVFSFELDWKC